MMVQRLCRHTMTVRDKSSSKTTQNPCFQTDAYFRRTHGSTSEEIPQQFIEKLRKVHHHEKHMLPRGQWTILCIIAVTSNDTQWQHETKVPRRQLKIYVFKQTHIFDERMVQRQWTFLCIIAVTSNEHNGITIHRPLRYLFQILYIQRCVVTENQELSQCQLCPHWCHCGLS